MLKSKPMCRFLQRIILVKSPRRDLGSSLIELILALSIGSILLLSIYTVLNFTIGFCKAREDEDEILLNRRYAIEYIKREIESAEEIIDINYGRFKSLDDEYEENIGFIIMECDLDESNKKIYNYSTYYIKNNKLYRVAANTSSDQYPRSIFFKGNNVIAEHMVSFSNTSIDFDMGLVDLRFILAGDTGDEGNLGTKIWVRCPIVY